jgi:transketolase
MAHFNDKTILFLEEKANHIRESIITMLAKAGSGHTAGPLGMADIFTALYFHILRHNPHDPFWNDRDRLVLSNGHICPVLYATMAHAGYFSPIELLKLRQFGSRLQGHPHREWLPGLETSSGPLGSGLSQAIGMALADRMDNGRSSDKQFYCLMGDGELNEGQVWEAAMCAGKEKIQNLTIIIDRNNIQIDGFTEDIMPLEPLSDKWRAFGFHVQDINGHDFIDIVNAFGEAKATFEKPSVIIAHTIPGKGVAFAERRFEWHGIPPGASDVKGAPEKSKQAAEALRMLRTFDGRISNEHE